MDEPPWPRKGESEFSFLIELLERRLFAAGRVELFLYAFWTPFYGITWNELSIEKGKEMRCAID